MLLILFGKGGGPWSGRLQEHQSGRELTSLLAVHDQTLQHACKIGNGIEQKLRLVLHMHKAQLTFSPCAQDKQQLDQVPKRKGSKDTTHMSQTVQDL